MSDDFTGKEDAKLNKNITTKRSFLFQSTFNYL